ncbi:hypothetical protein SMMN14_01182 [Sphaerulina musiva]
MVREMKREQYIQEIKRQRKKIQMAWAWQRVASLRLSKIQPDGWKAEAARTPIAKYSGANGLADGSSRQTRTPTSNLQISSTAFSPSPARSSTASPPPTDTMPFTKLVKNSAYFSRYQVKYKRRRSGKTDYYARKRLITQAKNKYNAPKYRLVVRFTNRDIIAQIVTSELTGDKVFVAAYGHELKRYGVTHGLTNWAAAYCVGLLIARRALNKLELEDTFTGVEEADGEFTETQPEEVDGETRRPFKVFLDVGLTRTSTGARVFGAMKGASDGGLYVPHSEKRFPGYDIETKELDAETLRKYIFAGHVAEYMETLADDDEERYKSQFSGYIDDEIEADGLEELYQEAHKAIREDPWKKDEDAGEKKTKEEWKAESQKYKLKKLTHEERRQRVQEKIKTLAQEL